MKNFFLIFVALLIGAFQLYAQDENDLKSMFNEMNKEFADMMVANDHEGILKWYADDVIQMPNYSPILRGIDALKEAQKKEEQSGVKFTAFTLETTDVLPAGDYFIEIGKYTLSMEIPEMGSMDDHGKYMTVWEKRDGDWKIRADTWNTDNNPWMQMEGEQDDYGKHEETGKDE